MRARLIKRLMIVALALIVLFGAAPMLATVLAPPIARMLGCPLNAGGAQVCFLFGRDIGGALHTMFVSNWYVRVTIPMAAMVLVVWAVTALILLLLHRRRRRRRQMI